MGNIKHAFIARVYGDDIAGLFKHQRLFQRDEDVFHEGEQATLIGCVLSGLLCRYKTQSDGRRQIIGALVPGDLFDLNVPQQVARQHGVSAVMESIVAFTPPEPLRALANANAEVYRALSLERYADLTVAHEWIVNCAARSATARVGCLLCALCWRLRAVGLMSDEGASFDLRQRVLAEATGLSVIHVNRVLKQLREDGLVVIEHGRLSIPHLARLMDFVGYDPEYLLLERRVRFAQPSLGGAAVELDPV